MSHKALNKSIHIFKKFLNKLLPRNEELVFSSELDNLEVEQKYKYPNFNDIYVDFSHFIFVLTLIWVLSPTALSLLPKNFDFFLYKILPIFCFLLLVATSLSFYNFKKVVEHNSLVFVLTILSMSYIFFIVGSVTAPITFVSFGFVLSFWFANLFLSVERFLKDQKISFLIMSNIYTSLPFLMLLNDKIMSVYLVQNTTDNIFNMSILKFLLFLLLPASIGVIILIFYNLASNAIKATKTRHLPCILFFNGFLLFYLISLFVAFFWMFIPMPNEDD